MSTLSQFVGQRATTQIVNAHSSGGTFATTLQASSGNGMREVLSGALTANTLATVLSVTGAGRLSQLTAYSKDVTSRTIRLVVEVDGLTVFDATSSAVAAANQGIFAVASGVGSVVSNGEPIVFNSSLVVRIASSLTETDKVAIGYALVRN